MELKTEGEIPMVMADEKRLRQIMDNLLNNAIKYSDDGTEITVRIEKKEKEIEMSVADQGAGIADTEIDKVFDRMYRIEQRLSDDPGGMGLGLALCKGLVEAHNGRIWIESVEGKGSTAFFTLPLGDEGDNT
jgi:two-component system sensor histidine kinase VicK